MEYDQNDNPHLQNHVLQLKNESTVHEDIDSLSWLHQDSSSSPSLHGSASSMVNFEDVNNHTSTHQKPLVFTKKMNNASKIRSRSTEEEILFDDDGTGSFSQKKRRLSTDQVRFLEKSFEVDNKLEPDRKLQLAKELGLQPRQVAIWFQNRRARYKTKVLEKDYDVLKSNYDRLKRDFDALYSENEKLKNEVNRLTQKLLLGKENDEHHHQLDKSEPCDHDSNNVQSDDVDVKQLSKTSSAKSDVLDGSDSPHYDRGNCLTTMLDRELGDSSHAFEAETKINSNYEEADHDILSNGLLIHFPKLEEVDSYYDDHLLQPNSCNNLGYPVQNHGTWFWQI